MKTIRLGVWTALVGLTALGAHCAASGQSSAPAPAPAAAARNVRPPPPDATVAGARQIGGIDVTIQRKPSGVSQSTRTDREGRFAFAGLPAGTYAISFPPPSATTNPTAKSFFESRSNVRVAVTIPSKLGKQPPVIATGPLAAIVVTGSGASAARTAATSGEIPITLGAGDAVMGTVTAAP